MRNFRNRSSDILEMSENIWIGGGTQMTSHFWGVFIKIMIFGHFHGILVHFWGRDQKCEARCHSGLCNIDVHIRGRRVESVNRIVETDFSHQWLPPCIKPIIRTEMLCGYPTNLKQNFRNKNVNFHYRW